MVKFVSNNAKNASTGHTLFELNYSYYPRVLFKKNVDPYLKFHSINKLTEELKELMEVCW